jgi:hypothetical protein
MVKTSRFWVEKWSKQADFRLKNDQNKPILG